MASGEPWFQMTVHCDVRTLTPLRPLQFSLTAFILQVRKYLVDDSGNIIRAYDGAEEEFQEKMVFPEIFFGSIQHRNRIAQRLREAGCSQSGSLERMLDVAFSDAKQMLEQEEKKKREKKNNCELGLGGIPIIILRVKKLVRWEEELELELEGSSAMELSMQDNPPNPATKESIEALRKVKKIDGVGSSTEEDCMICMEQLISSESTELICMPCSHLFHGDCIQKWLSCSHLCPLCRFPMPTYGTS